MPKGLPSSNEKILPCFSRCVYSPCVSTQQRSHRIWRNRWLKIWRYIPTEKKLPFSSRSEWDWVDSVEFLHYDNVLVVLEFAYIRMLIMIFWWHTFRLTAQKMLLLKHFTVRKQIKLLLCCCLKQKWEHDTVEQVTSSQVLTLKSRQTCSSPRKQKPHNELMCLCDILGSRYISVQSVWLQHA